MKVHLLVTSVLRTKVRCFWWDLTLCGELNSLIPAHWNQGRIILMNRKYSHVGYRLAQNLTSFFC